MDKKQIIKEFLNNNDQSFLEVPDRINKNYTTIFYKVRFLNHFDYIYCLDYINQAPSRDKKAEFCGVVDRRTKKLYFADYDLRKCFDYFDGIKYVEELKFTDIKTISDQINADIKKEVDKIAEQVADDEESDNDLLYRLTEETTIKYFKNENVEKQLTAQQKDRQELAELLKYISNPADMVAEIIKTNYEKIIEHIKFIKMWNRKAKEAVITFETDPSFKYLRMAKDIKDSIPEDSRSVNLTYRMSNGETITGKMETETLHRLPTWQFDKMHYFLSYIDRPTREKIQEIDGRCTDIYIKNILSITYKNKTLWSNPDNLAGV